MADAVDHDLEVVGVDSVVDGVGVCVTHESPQSGLRRGRQGGNAAV